MSKAGKIKWANKREKLWTGSGERVQAASGIMPRFIPRCAVAASLGVSGAAGFLPYPSVHAPLGIVCSAQSGRLCSAIFPARASATKASPARGAMHMRMSGRGRTTPSDDSIGPTTEEEKLPTARHCAPGTGGICGSQDIGRIPRTQRHGACSASAKALVTKRAESA